MMPEADTTSERTLLGRYQVRAPGDLSTVPLQVRLHANELGFADTAAVSIGTAASELATNLLAHAGGGALSVYGICESRRNGIELLAEDSGPGIRDIPAALQDHVSGAGTLGLGLPGVRRLMHDFSIDSAEGQGTTVRARKWLAESQSPVEHGTYTRVCSGETVSGDAYLVLPRGDRLLLAVIDGLGHGEPAYAVATRGIATLRQRSPADPVTALTCLNDTLRGTRGAVGVVAVVHVPTGQVRVAGIGDAIARKIGDASTRFVSLGGVLGKGQPRFREQQDTLGPRDVLLLYSDGVSDRFEPADYATISIDPARVVAKNVVLRFGKTHDDATCVALRYRR